MVERKPEILYKSSRKDGKRKFCDIFTFFSRSLSPDRFCPRPSETCIDCPVSIWWNGREKKIGFDFKEAIEKAKERAPNK